MSKIVDLGEDKTEKEIQKKIEKGLLSKLGGVQQWLVEGAPQQQRNQGFGNLTYTTTSGIAPATYTSAANVLLNQSNAKL